MQSCASFRFLLWGWMFVRPIEFIPIFHFGKLVANFYEFVQSQLDLLYLLMPHWQLGLGVDLHCFFHCTFLYKSHEIQMKSSAFLTWDRIGSVCLVCFMEGLATQANKRLLTTVLTFLLCKCGHKIIKPIIWDQEKHLNILNI